jgi:hypothetical protein
MLLPIEARSSPTSPYLVSPSPTMYGGVPADLSIIFTTKPWRKTACEPHRSPPSKPTIAEPELEGPTSLTLPFPLPLPLPLPPHRDPRVLNNTPLPTMNASPMLPCFSLVHELIHREHILITTVPSITPLSSFPFHHIPPSVPLPLPLPLAWPAAVSSSTPPNTLTGTHTIRRILNKPCNLHPRLSG